MRPAERTRKTARKIAALLPPLRRMLVDRDDLRRKNIELQQEVGRLAHELKAARAKFLTSWQQQPDLWVRPGHFYSPIPAVKEVKINEHEIFEIPSAIRGVDLNQTFQFDLLKRFTSFYPEQPFTSQAMPGRRYFFENPNYSYNDAIVLYCMIRHTRPARIVEIGSGYSSCAILDVNDLFFGNSIECTFIDPYPQLLQDLIKEADLQRVRILSRKVQDIDPDLFRELRVCDILFIDSSHITKTGSDVNYIVFKILPLLEEGVYIHFHDIFYPFEYPAEWVYEGRGWNEAYLLRAFLQYNRAFEIQFFNSLMIERHRDLFESKMPLCLKHAGANLWLRKTLHDRDLDRAHARSERKQSPVPKMLDLTSPEHVWFLRDGWYEPEADHCWMGQVASFQIAGPIAAGQRLVVHAVNPLNSSRLTATADDVELGSIQLGLAGYATSEFSLPDVLIGRRAMTVRLAVDRIHIVAADPRKLGLAVSRIEIR